MGRLAGRPSIPGAYHHQVVRGTACSAGSLVLAACSAITYAHRSYAHTVDVASTVCEILQAITDCYSNAKADDGQFWAYVFGFAATTYHGYACPSLVAPCRKSFYS
jgi:hypothetical protein